MCVLFLWSELWYKLWWEWRIIILLGDTNYTWLPVFKGSSGWGKSAHLWAQVGREWWFIFSIKIYWKGFKHAEENAAVDKIDGIHTPFEAVPSQLHSNTLQWNTLTTFDKSNLSLYKMIRFLIFFFLQYFFVEFFINNSVRQFDIHYIHSITNLCLVKNYTTYLHIRSCARWPVIK